MPPFLEVRGLTKRFGATLALDDVSTEFHAGSIHCVLGENGAGKSTLGKIIGGLYAQDSGQVLLEGGECRLGTVARAAAAGIAVVFQELSMAPDLSVRANLLLGVEPHRLPFARLRRSHEAAAVTAILERLDVHVDPETPVGRLPVATRQLLEVGKALARRPRMIVLDEPTAMLGEVDKRKLYGVLSKLRADGTALALVTHHLEDVEALATHVSIMRDGRLIDGFAVDGHDAAQIASRLSEPQRSSIDGPAPVKQPAADAFLEITGLSDRRDRPTSIRLFPGRILALYGVAGCGAERVVAALTGVSRGSRLDVRIDGSTRVIDSPNGARRLGIAHLPTGRAANGILPGRSIRENLNLGRASAFARTGVISRAREAASTRRELRDNAVKYVGIDDDMASLSGGNQQKVLAARALACAGRVVVLEDPTAGVDLAAKRQILEAIRARADSGLAVLLVSSDLAESISAADTLLTMFSGRVMRQYDAPDAGDRPAIVADVIGHGNESVPANAC